jgi:ubiquinone/menaquinone biosynthesis C-methylase UbiE
VDGFRTRLSKQLSNPSGRFGRIVAAGMNRGNREMNEHAIDLLGVDAGDHVLDIGFGGGRAVEMMLERGLRVTGVDPAGDMVAALAERYDGDPAADRLTVREGGVESLPLGDGEADGALTVNTVYFWSELLGSLAEINRVLSPTGTLVIAIRDGAVMRNVDRDVFTIRSPETIAAAAESTGFDTRVESPPNGKLHFIVAKKSG